MLRIRTRTCFPTCRFTSNNFAQGGFTHERSRPGYAFLRHRQPQPRHPRPLLRHGGQKKGKDVSVFLLDEGVYLAKRGVIEHLQAATGDSADDHLHYLQEYGVPLLVCTPCAVTRQVTEADLVKGARMAKGDELIDLAVGSAVLSF